MADFYLDSDGGSDANNGTTWSLAKLTQESAFSVMSAGDNLWKQGAAADDSVSDRTLTSPGTISNPCLITGVVDGTTNEPPLLADLAVTLPVISTTGAAPDINFSGVAQYSNIEISSGDRVSVGSNAGLKIVNGKLSHVDRLITSAGAEFITENTIIDTVATSSDMHIQAGSSASFYGGSLVQTAASSLFRFASNGNIFFSSFDMSALGTTNLISSATQDGSIKLINCKTPSIFNVISGTPNGLNFKFEAVGCSDASSVAATDSIQDYQYEDAYGTIDLETTAVRTGGADDDASGAFSYAMTPAASATLESSGATLKGPWMSVWVDGGSNTLTVYIANDSASTDYNLNEAWCEFYTPDAGDTAQYDQTFDAGDARLLDSSTAITDDTGSSWGTGGNNHQKFSATVTTGYTGWAYARLHLAKRSATPDTLFLDPRIGLS